MTERAALTQAGPVWRQPGAGIAATVVSIYLVVLIGVQASAGGRSEGAVAVLAGLSGLTTYVCRRDRRLTVSPAQATPEEA